MPFCLLQTQQSHLNMKMARVFLTTLVMFHLVLVPSKAFPLGGMVNPNDGSYGNDNSNDNNFQDYQGINPEPEKKKDEGLLVEQNPVEGEEQKPIEQGAEPVKINANLVEGFYSQSCPNAEKIVADVLAETVKTNPNAIPNLIRLQFHDCFVGGCDASILLDYIPSGDLVEKSSLFNGILLKGSDVIDDIKAKLEEECPQTVSCADTLAFATNEALSLAGLPPRRPLGGRRDALVSLASIAEDNNLPLPNWNMDQMLNIFEKKGFSAEEMVILLGAHSVGSAHCDLFMNRIYNFEDTKQPDPELTEPVVDELRQICKNPGTPQFRNPPVSFDETPVILDNLFFKNMVEKRKTLLVTDSYLLHDPRTAPTVQNMAAEADLFGKRFAEMMIKLSSLNVITGNDGEVRKTCRSTN